MNGWWHRAERSLLAGVVTGIAVTVGIDAGSSRPPKGTTVVHGFVGVALLTAAIVFTLWNIVAARRLRALRTGRLRRMRREDW